MKKSLPLTISVLLPVTVLILLFSCILGSVKLWETDAETAKTILVSIRIPRVLAGALAGAGLSLSGVLLQSVTGNPLAAPNIIGVNSGAGFFCIIMLSFFPLHLTFLPFGAFIGAFISTLIIVGIAGRINGTRSTIILAGIALTAILNAGISLLSLLDSYVLSSYNAFSIGGLSGVKFRQLTVPFIIVTVCLTVSLLLSRRIHTMCLGDSIALALGVRVKLLRTVCLICASASAAAVVSFAGLLGFVGLIVPHIARRLSGERTSSLIVTSSLIGASLVCSADLLGRILLSPTEIPVGVIMALIGAPFFFVLLLRKEKNDA